MTRKIPYGIKIKSHCYYFLLVALAAWSPVLLSCAKESSLSSAFWNRLLRINERGRQLLHPRKEVIEKETAKNDHDLEESNFVEKELLANELDTQKDANSKTSASSSTQTESSYSPSIINSSNIDQCLNSSNSYVDANYTNATQEDDRIFSFSNLSSNGEKLDADKHDIKAKESRIEASDDASTVGNDIVDVFVPESLPLGNNTTTVQESQTTIQSSNENDFEKESRGQESELSFSDWKEQSTANDRKNKFLERISIMSSTLLRREFDASMLPTEMLRRIIQQLSIQKDERQQQTEEEIDNKILESVTPQSDLSLPGRYIHIVTTAALPWFTGTAVNPLLRAAYLHRRTLAINAEYEKDDGNGTVVSEHIHFHHKKSYVTLVIPWLELPEDQIELYNNRIFESPSEQEEYIRNWLRNEANMEDAANDLEILFYPARYHSGLRSVFAMGDIMDVIPPANRDVCILEEPEHCNWFRAPGHGWTKQFNYVVGIVHTNYKEYALSHYSGLWTAPAIQLVSAAMVRAYCHKVIKLSSILQSFAPEKEATSNVHGVRSDFVDIGLKRQQYLSTREISNTSSNDAAFQCDKVLGNETSQVYFIGKLLWAKGLDIMLELEDYYKQITGDYFTVDIYGNGPDSKAIMRAFHGFRMYQKKENEKSDENSEFGPQEDAIENERDASSFNIHIMGTTLPVGSYFDDGSKSDDSLPSLELLQLMAKKKIAKLKETINAVEIPKSFSEFRRQPIPASFPGRVDHATLKNYKVFVNPSISEVLCTTTAEALAMGKFAIVPDHPSNKFFLQFPNCLAYQNKFEFVANLRWALTHEPEPLTPELAHLFTWEAATDRLIDASAVTYQEALERERIGSQKFDERIAWLHNELGKGHKGDWLRKLFGAGPVSYQVKYQMSKQSSSSSDTNEKDDDFDDGLTGKFYKSSFAKALRAALEDVSLMIQ